MGDWSLVVMGRGELSPKSAAPLSFTVLYNKFQLIV